MAGTGYDETSGWGVFDVANFIADPLGDKNPTATPTAPQALATVPAEPIASACQALFTTYSGNATDPVTDMNDANLDITSGSLGLLGTNLFAQLAGPALAPGTDAAGTNGTEYFAAVDVCRNHLLRDGVRGPNGTQIFYNDGNASDSSLRPRPAAISPGALPTGR